MKMKVVDINFSDSVNKQLENKEINKIDFRKY
jgi:hypothetical protein